MEFLDSISQFRTCGWKLVLLGRPKLSGIKRKRPVVLWLNPTKGPNSKIMLRCMVSDFVFEAIIRQYHDWWIFMFVGSFHMFAFILPSLSLSISLFCFYMYHTRHPLSFIFGQIFFKFDLFFPRVCSTMFLRSFLCAICMRAWTCVWEREKACIGIFSKCVMYTASDTQATNNIRCCTMFCNFSNSVIANVLSKRMLSNVKKNVCVCWQCVWYWSVRRSVELNREKSYRYYRKGQLVVHNNTNIHHHYHHIA